MESYAGLQAVPLLLRLGKYGQATTNPDKEQVECSIYPFKLSVGMQTAMPSQHGTASPQKHGGHCAQLSCTDQTVCAYPWLCSGRVSASACRVFRSRISSEVQKPLQYLKYPWHHMLRGDQLTLNCQQDLQATA